MLVLFSCINMAPPGGGDSDSSACYGTSDTTDDGGNDGLPAPYGRERLWRLARFALLDPREMGGTRIKAETTILVLATRRRFKA